MHTYLLNADGTIWHPTNDLGMYAVKVSTPIALSPQQLANVAKLAMPKVDRGGSWFDMFDVPAAGRRQATVLAWG